jgi:hypothetical protein
MGLAHNTLDDILRSLSDRFPCRKVSTRGLGGTILLGLPDGEETWDIDR